MKKKCIRDAIQFYIKTKLWRIMRISVFLLFMCISQTWAVSVYSQQTRLTLKMENTRIVDVLDEIEDKSEFYFLFSKELVDVNKKININLEDKTIEEILSKILSETDIKYQVENRQIVLTPSNVKINLEQTKSVSGKVTDSSGAPLPGVSIVIKGTATGTIADFDGNFRLPNVPADATLVFSFVGMRTQEFAVAGQTSFNIIMEEDAIGLEEVIAVGYASQKKANVVGSVTSVSGETIAAIPAADISNAISGRLPGATVIQESGEPGQNEAKVLVRGRTTLGDEDVNTAPLVVVDGIPGRSLGEIDPIDIESITILKDAAAAIYGAAAANGVILVTTKRGKGGKPRLNYQFYQGFMQPTILPEVTSAGDYATMLSEYQDYEGRNRTYSDEDIALFYSGRDPWEHPNSDWVGDLIADWTTTSKHNISLDGGNNGMYYYVSLGYRNEEAIYKQESTNYKQYNLRAKLEIPINDWLTTSIDYAGFLTEKLYPTKGAGSIYGQSQRLVPTQWSFWPTGEPGPDIEYGDNPVVTSTLETGTDSQKNYINQTTFKASIKPPMIKGLSIDGSYTYDVNNQYRKKFQKPWILYFPKWDTAVRDSEGFITSMELTPTPRGVSSPELTEYYDRSIRKLGIISASWARTFDKHDISIFGAYEELSREANDFDAFRKYYISDVVQTLDAGADADKDNGGSMSIYARKSWIGRFNYSYEGKYLMEVLFRRDGSLKFPEDNRWGNFPAVLLGWRASEEDFWKDKLSFINYFKLRASYGKMGMDPGASFQFMNKYVLASGPTMGTGKVVETVVRQEGVANPNITWEKQTTYNIGFDSQILNKMFHLNTEFFYSKRTDILHPRDASVPGFTGLALPDENIAEVDNRGFEIDAGYHKKFNNDLHLNLSGNISYNHNEVVFMDEPERAVPWQQRTGHSYGAKLLYNAIGIFKDQAHVDSYPHWSALQ